MSKFVVMSATFAASVLYCSATVGSAFAAASPAATCTVAKQKAAVKKLAAKVKCHGAAIKKDVAVDLACLGKAEEKFEAAFAKAEAKGGCVTEGDTASVEALVDGWLAELLDATGTQTKTVFISSLSYNGNLGGLAGADAKCQALADAANLPGTYAAWLSDNTGNAATRLTPSSGSYTLVGGTLIANDFADLVDGSLVSTITQDENGAVVNSRAWTGTSPDGTACYQGSGGNCNLTSPGNDGLVRTACANWTEAVALSEAVTGHPSTSGPWTLEGDRACPDMHRLYCIEQ